MTRSSMIATAAALSFCLAASAAQAAPFKLAEKRERSLLSRLEVSACLHRPVVNYYAAFHPTGCLSVLLSQPRRKLGVSAP
jgi:hypothetical protein